jgi:hypothetical protein
VGGSGGGFGFHSAKGLGSRLGMRYLLRLFTLPSEAQFVFPDRGEQPRRGLILHEFTRCFMQFAAGRGAE